MKKNSPQSFVDANIILRILLKDDEQLQKSAINAVNKQPPKSCLITSLTIAEVIYILRSYGYDRASCVDAIEGLLQIQQFLLEESITHRALDTFRAKGLDFADCYLLMRSIHQGSSLLTQDKKLAKAYLDIAS